MGTVDGLDTHHKIAAQAYKIINMKKDRSGVNAVEKTTRDTETDEVDAIHGPQGRGQQGTRGSGSARGGGRKPGPGPSSKENFVFRTQEVRDEGILLQTCKQGCSFAGLPVVKNESENGPAGQ